MQEINALEANTGSVQQISSKCLSFSHKDLAQNKLYTYFNIVDAKSLVKLKEK